MNTIDYRTKTLFIKNKQLTVGDKWGIAVDIGYSGTKIYGPNIIACFPSFALPVKGNLLDVKGDENSAILYRGEDGVIWKVGKSAQDTISPLDPDTASMAIYGRQRYFDPMFLVVARTALGIACTENEFGSPKGKEIFLETGLPNSYIRADTPLLRDVLSGTHSFDLKIGSSGWMHYDIDLEEKNIFVMQQPMGALVSVSTDENGDSDQAYYKSSVLICDPGFGTMDCFSLKGGEMNGVETFDSLGMKQVLSETVNKIYEKYRVEIPVPAVQKYLENGYITTFDRKTRTGNNVDFSDILEESSEKVANRAIDKLSELYNDLLEYRYLIITGGTGQAWYDKFENAFKGLPNLTLVPGNQRMPVINKKMLPFIFANVRGYYLYLMHKFMRQK